MIFTWTIFYRIISSSNSFCERHVISFLFQSLTIWIKAQITACRIKLQPVESNICYSSIPKSNILESSSDLDFQLCIKFMILVFWRKYWTVDVKSRKGDFAILYLRKKQDKLEKYWMITNKFSLFLNEILSKAKITIHKCSLQYKSRLNFYKGSFVPFFL